MSSECGGDSSVSGAEEAMVDLARMVRNNIKRTMARPAHSLVIIIVLLTYLGLVTQGSLITSSGLNINTAEKQKHPRKGKIVATSANDSLLLTEYNRRRKLVKSTCEQYGAYTSREKLRAKLLLGGENGQDQGQRLPGVETDEQLWSLLKRSSHHQFFVQREYNLMWCKVPKAASTSWLYAFLSLAHVPQSQIPEDNGLGLHAFLREKYPLLTKNLFKKLITQTIKFLVVRHPFERLMSAYVDKLESYSRDVDYRGGYYYAMYGHDIVASYRAKYKQKFPANPLFEKKEPSFVEFVEYLIETPLDKYDEHWKPIFVLCPPCHFNFDIIVKMETFKRDTQFLLNQRGLDSGLLTRKHSTKAGESDGDLKKRLFSQLSKKMVSALQDKYRIDLTMFEYDVEEYMQLASDSEGFMPDQI